MEKRLTITSSSDFLGHSKKSRITKLSVICGHSCRAECGACLKASWWSEAKGGPYQINASLAFCGTTCLVKLAESVCFFLDLHMYIIYLYESVYLYIYIGLYIYYLYTYIYIQYGDMIDPTSWQSANLQALGSRLANPPSRIKFRRNHENHPN